MNDKQATFIIFGASGDLAKRKLVPALYDLLLNKQLEKCLIIGAAFDDITALDILERAREFIPNIDQTVFQKLSDCFYYEKLNFTHFDDYQLLKTLISELEKKHTMPGNRMVYLAAPPQFFCSITEYVGRAKIIERSDDSGHVKDVWHRIVYEKPFGLDFSSAHAVNECILQWFNEHQVYRIDHYLTKAIVGTIALVRFTNIIFEPLWNNLHVDNVQINLTETIGLEGRGHYYDKYGVVKDVVQNHMLQLLALIAMESPEKLTGDAIRDKKAEVLKYVRPVDGILGQYATYLNEPDVEPDSLTPTFALLRMMIDTPRWHGVPFYLKSGKKLDKKESSIYITFKKVDCPLKRIGVCASNVLKIAIAPEPYMSLELNIKKPGIGHQVMPVDMVFSHANYFGPNTMQAYEVLLLEIIAGEQSVSVRFDEIEYSWKIVDAVDTLNLPLYSYKADSKGPLEIEELAQKYGVEWYR